MLDKILDFLTGDYKDPYKIKIKDGVVLCECGARSDKTPLRGGDPFTHFLKTEVEIGERQRKVYKQFKILICRGCKAEVPEEHLIKQIHEKV